MTETELQEEKRKRKFLRLPVVSLSAEFLVMGYLMRRNILSYKAPPGNEGYDLICIHPDPKRDEVDGQKRAIRVQVKSRYATDCDRGFPLKEGSIEGFDYLIVVFLNIGSYNRGRDGSNDMEPVEFYTLSKKFIGEHYAASKSWSKVNLKNLDSEIAPFKNELGFDVIAADLGITRPTRPTEEEPSRLP